MFCFLKFRRKQVPPAPPHFPEHDQEVAWMEQKLVWARACSPEVAARLFDPTDGDYLLNAIAAGTHLTPDIREAYKAIRDRNPDLAEVSKTGPMSYNVSRIAEPSDLEAHRHRIHHSLL